MPWSSSIFSPNPNWWWCHPLKVRWPLRSSTQDLHHQRPWHNTCTRICPAVVITTHQLLAFPRKTINSYDAHVLLPLPRPEDLVLPHNLHTSLCSDECDYQKGITCLDSWAYEEECHYFLRENGIIARIRVLWKCDVQLLHRGLGTINAFCYWYRLWMKLSVLILYLLSKPSVESILKLVY